MRLAPGVEANRVQIVDGDLRAGDRVVLSEYLGLAGPGRGETAIGMVWGAAMSEQTVIDVRGVSKVFQTDEVRTHALTDVHMSVRQGEYVAISGPSGCGKSTLMSILGLLDTPTSGDAS